MNQVAIDFEASPMVQARAVGQVAAELAQQRAERKDPDFTERAKAHILEQLRLRGEASGETLTDSCKAAGIAPANDRAFGSVYSSLARAGEISCVGFCLRAKGHGTAGGRVWRIA